MTSPLDIRYDLRSDRVTIEGVQYSGDFFRTFASPKPDKFYRFRAENMTVRVEELTSCDWACIWHLIKTRLFSGWLSLKLRFKRGNRT